MRSSSGVRTEPILTKPRRASVALRPENGAPIAGEVRVERPDSGTGQIGTELSSEYVVKYRTLLPPDQKVEVIATVVGVVTEHGDFTERGTSEESWIDEVVTPLFLMILVHRGARTARLRARTLTRSPDPGWRCGERRAAPAGVGSPS